MSGDLTRRQFIGTTAGVAAGAVTLRGQNQNAAIVIDPEDAVASSSSARWAAGELERELTGRGISARVYSSTAEVPANHLRIFAAGMASPEAREALSAAGASTASVPEALALCEGSAGIWACGQDARGLTYALLELADRVHHAEDPRAALAIPQPISEQPANTIRSVTRLFTSDVEDKPWYNDRQMWPEYLSMLASRRFNRFSLALGIGYDFLQNVTDGYFLFAYPFLLSVPGYDVRVPELPDDERDSNLEMLRFISEQTVARGMEFQLGIWMHGYEWLNSPFPNYTIEGLTPEIHGAYCRDAVRALLQAVPHISGVTFRVHGESGVPEGNYQFWKTVFDGVKTCGRTVEIDMHAKGMDQGMIDTALGTNQPVKISPKFWAEHLGMPYHQADIRALERPRPASEASDLMKFSAGSRRFLRYGYGDLLQEDREWGILHRIWPGTQRLLIWGDPLTAAAYSKAFSFCGSDGVEIMEPLSFKGRRGSGIAGGRCGYAEESLEPRWDWQKYEYSHRVWGRLLYNPKTGSDVWKRAMRSQFGTAGAPLETALANSSRILPIVTTAHGTSAGNNSYWPEVYLNHSLYDFEDPGPYRDSPRPRTFGNVSPLDPQLFYRINDYADDLLKGEQSGKYTPVEVAKWLEDCADSATEALRTGDQQATGKNEPGYRRLTIDVAVAADIGRFFGSKFRAGVLYRIFEKTGDRAALEAALKAYREARDVWAEIVERTKDVYVPDITVGEHRQLRGHWAGRLHDIDADIYGIAAKLDSAKPNPADGKAARAIAQVLEPPERPAGKGSHTEPTSFTPGRQVALEFEAGQEYASVQLHYRHVNQAERWQSVSMKSDGPVWSASIPSEYTESPYPLQYYFELREGPESATLYPGLGEELTDQPYYVIQRA